MKTPKRLAGFVEEGLVDEVLGHSRSNFSAYVPALEDTRFGKEIWRHHEGGFLTPELPLTGVVAPDEHLADVDGVLAQIDEAIRENEIRQLGRLAASAV